MIAATATSSPVSAYTATMVRPTGTPEKRAARGL